MIALRPYQEKAIAAARASIMSGKRAPIIVAPTGAGKTAMAGMMVRGRVERGGKVAWMAHRKELITQAARTLENFGVPVGYLGTNPSAPVQVISVQSALTRGKVPDADMLIADEAHHYAGAEQWEAIPKMYLAAGAIVIGLTATPERGDGVGLHGVYDDLIVAAQIGELVEMGYLLPSKISHPSTRVRSGEISESPVVAWKDKGEDRSTVVFAANVKAAEKFAGEFEAEGVRAVVVHGKLSGEVRDQRLADFDSGAAKVIVNVGILTEGWDCPSASCCIFARTVGNTSLYLQMVGRVLRPHPGQEYARVIDLTGVVKKHGHPEEEREYFLEGQAIRRKGETAADRFCRVCKAVMTEGLPCPDCGSTLGGTEAPKVAGIELVEMDKWEWAKELSSNKRVNMLARWYAAAYEKGQKEGSADHRYRAIFKHFPSNAVKSEAREVAERMRA